MRTLTARVCWLTILLLSYQSVSAQRQKNIADVKVTYLQMAGKYQTSTAAAEKDWDQIAALYSDSTRHYHTLQHLANFYNELLHCKDSLSNWEAVFVSMVYHDVIYVSTSRDNEEKSAVMAADHLQRLGFPQSFIDTCRYLIMATKTHKATNNITTNLFIDADMSILGVPLDQYKIYVQQVHQEYAVVPNFAERRKGFLKALLDTKRIFITPQFFELYEKTARNNLRQEIKDFQ